MSLRVIFAGTPEFAVPTLNMLVAERFDVVAVLTQPDRPKGRGQRVTASPVKVRASELGIDVLQFHRLTKENIAVVRGYNPDLVVVAAYGLILPRAMLELPKFGCVNVHASLLPRWRGAAPIARAIENGDRESGITIMQMDEGLDTGPVWSRVSKPIHEDDTTATLAARLAVIGAEAMRVQLPVILAGDLEPQAQTDQQVTYAEQLNAKESVINWDMPAATIEHQIRAYNPWPIARTWFGEDLLLLWSAEVVAQSGNGIKPGTVVESDRKKLVVATGDGCLSLLRIQKAGRKQLPVAVFLSGTRIPVGTCLQSVAQTHQRKKHEHAG